MRALGDRSAAANISTPLLTTGRVTFTALLVAVEMSPQVATDVLVSIIDTLIDCLMAGELGGHKRNKSHEPVSD